MLLDLRIDNFAIIDHLELNFGAGLIAFTGETGAGKSIIIDAVNALLGSRADTTQIRAGVDRANIEGTFRISAGIRKPVQEILRREDLLDSPDMVTFGREIRREGRSVARINGRSVNVSLLREIGDYLVDIHGQSEHLSLLRVRHHRELIDRFAGLEPQLDDYQGTFRRLRSVRAQLEKLRQSEQDAARRVDLLNYQINEIESAQLQVDEEEGLSEERVRLANAEKLSSLAQKALVSLDNGTPETPAATDLLGQVVDAMHSLKRTDPSQAGLDEQARHLFDQVTELSSGLRNYLEGIEYNPKRLGQVEDRLDLIHTLKKKYGASIPDVLTFAEDARQELDSITHTEERIQELEAEEAALLGSLGEKGKALSMGRRAAAKRLSQALEAELTDLRMESARFTVDFQMRPDLQGVPLKNGDRVAFDASGLDQIEFLVAPNPGEGFKPLVKIASGGETSRLMLGLKNVLARADFTPSLIFDEIDQGIGGRVGTVVGQKLWSLARAHQVLCVTHLPQLAAFGDQHFRVLKALNKGRTVTRVEHLGGEPRLTELAQMMGEVSFATLQSAQEILQMARETTSTRA